MSDLVKRLRDLADSAAVGKKLYAGAFVVLEAAAEIERLRARLAEAVEVVRKIANEALSIECAPSELAIADFREAHDAHVLDARSFLAKVEEPNEKLKEVYRTGKAMLAASPDPATAEARLAEAVEVLLDVNDAAQIDVLMEGPRLQGWRRSELDRLWPKLRAFLAKVEGR